MTTTTNIMGFLDENKDDIPEGLYLKFCNLLKKENEEEQKEEPRFYKVKYLYTKFEPLSEDSHNYYSSGFYTTTQILKIDTKIYKEIQEDIEKFGYSRVSNGNLAFYNVFNGYSICSKESCNDIEGCGCDGEGHIKSTTIHVRSDTRIIKISEA
jgi:hypothetical protein